MLLVITFGHRAENSLKLLKLQSSGQVEGTSCLPSVVPEVEEGKMSGQPVLWEVQLSIFRGDPLKTPIAGIPVMA